jgi:hypothetical protein
MAFNRILDFSNGLDFYLGFFFLKHRNFGQEPPVYVYLGTKIYLSQRAQPVSVNANCFVMPPHRPVRG